MVFQRQYAWESAGIKAGPPWLEEWPEPFPAWAFEGAFLSHLIDIPMAVLMAMKVFNGKDALVKAATESLADMSAETRFGSSLALEHCIFASHFGIFLSDFFVHFFRPDPKFIAHHICAMALLVAGSFMETLLVLLFWLSPPLSWRLDR